MTSQDLDNVRVIHGATRIVRVASVSVCYSVRLNLFFFCSWPREIWGEGEKWKERKEKGCI